MAVERVGFIGLGTMGRAMAKNACGAGFALTVRDVNPAAVADLVALGARVAGSPREAAADADVVVSMVRDGRQTEDVMLGPDGALAGLKPGGVAILMSTIQPEVIRKVAAAAAGRGIVVIDAPVSGGEKRALAGTLTVMVGGDQATYEACRPLLGAMGTELFYLGPLCSGIVGKLINNMLVGVHLMATTEAMRVAANAGVDPKLLVDMLRTATGMSLMVKIWPKMEQAMEVGSHYRPAGTWALLQKDIHLALEHGRNEGIPMPVSNLAGQLFDELDFESGKNPFAS